MILQIQQKMKVAEPVVNSKICDVNIIYHCKKLEVDLTLKRSSQLQSGFIQVQVVVQLLLQGFSVTPFAIEDV